MHFFCTKLLYHSHVLPSRNSVFNCSIVFMVLNIAPYVEHDTLVSQTIDSCVYVLCRDGMIKRALYDKSLQKTLQLNQEKYASLLDLHKFGKENFKGVDHQEEEGIEHEEEEPSEDTELRKRTVFTVGLSDQ